MTTLFTCSARKWQAPLLAPQELATVTPERFANLFFKLTMNNKPLGLNDVRMLLTQCFTSMLHDRWHHCTQSAHTSRESVVQKWKDDKFWHHDNLARYYARIMPSSVPSTPKGPSSVRHRDVNRAIDHSSRGLPAPDLTKDWRKDRYLPSHRDSRPDSRRGASPGRSRHDAPKEPRYGRLEDRVEDPFRRIAPPKFAAEKTSANEARGSTSTPLKRVKVEHQRPSPPLTRPEPLKINLPPLTRSEPLKINLPPGQQVIPAPKVEPQEHPVANTQLYSPTTPHLTVNWPIKGSSKATEDSTGKESGLPESPALRLPGGDAQASEQAPRGSLKRPREDSPGAHTADEPTRPEVRASERPIERSSLPAGSEPGEISEAAGAAASAWTRSMRAPENGMSSQAILTEAGTTSLPSPSGTPNTATNGPFAGFFKPDDKPATNGASTNSAVPTSPSLPKQQVLVRLPPTTTSQRQRQTPPPWSANARFILLETLLRGAVRALTDGNGPPTAGQFRAETLLQGAVEELEKLKNDTDVV